MQNNSKRSSHLRRSIAAAVVLCAASTSMGQVINEENKLLASDGSGNDQYGHAVAIGDGVVVIGARSDDDSGLFSGSAYLVDEASGAQLYKILPSDPSPGDSFGFAVAVDGGVAAVGAVHGDSLNSVNTGAAYLFSTATGDQLFKLIASDAAVDNEFGCSIDLDNGVVAVGDWRSDDSGSASGSAYLFDVSTGTQLAKLVPNDASANANFGWSISIDNGIVAVGARRDGANGSNSGSAYLFDVATGLQIAKLLPNDGAAGDEFGYSISLDDGVVAVGSRWDQDNGTHSGSAYLFNVGTGTQIAKLLPTGGAPEDHFGRNIAIEGGHVVLGSIGNDENGFDSGSAYLFNVATGVQVAKLFPSDAAVNDWFGMSVAISNDIVVIGARYDDDNGSDSGSAYVFDITPTQCQIADTNADGTTNAADFTFWVGCFNLGLAFPGCDTADQNGDGVLSPSDFTAWIANFNSCGP